MGEEDGAGNQEKKGGGDVREAIACSRLRDSGESAI